MRTKSVPANVLPLDTMKLSNAILDQPTLAPCFRRIKAAGWQFFVVNQSRGRCYYHKQWITIPIFALKKEHTKPGYWVWYVAHEFAHYVAGSRANHGPLFMKELKILCPPKFVHYELAYKFENAIQAGIRKIDVERSKQEWDVDLLDLL